MIEDWYAIEGVNWQSGRKTLMRWWLLRALLVCVLAVLLGRSFYLQVVQGETWRADAQGNYIAAEPEPAPRGIIYDTNGREIVKNVVSTIISIDPAKLPPEDLESVIVEELPKIAGVDPDEVTAALMKARETRQHVTLGEWLSHEDILRVQPEVAKMPGVELTESLTREYQFGAAMAHAVGYTGIGDNDVKGVSGLEKQYEDLLKGRTGARYVQVSASGAKQKEVGYEPPLPGGDIETTLDVELQEKILQILLDKERVGAVVALDPRSGAVRGLVSVPAYDPNIFTLPTLRDQLGNVMQDEMNPLFNRAVSGTYPPGSTIKPLIAVAALEDGVITSATSIHSAGGISVGPWNFPDWKAGGHGPTNVTKAIAESVNTFFYVVSGGHEGRTGLGVKKISQYLNQFGWGEKTGVDLPQEAPGFLPSRKWKEEVKEEPWYIGDTYHLGIGQGDVLATPLQVAVGTGMIANSGNVYQPFLVRATRDEDGNLEEVIPESRDAGVSAAAIRTVAAGMRETVAGSSGSGRSLSDLAITLAGKTGTAQAGSGEDAPTHAWFTSYGPYENPELVITVLLEKGGAGDKDAVPVAREIWEWWARERMGG